jgi:hypothetical protein
MIYFTEKFGFEADEFDAVTNELKRVLNMLPEHRFNDSYGGDISLFEIDKMPDGHLILYHNHSGDASGPYVNEEDFPELGLVLLIEQQGEYVDYEPRLKRMEKFKPILLHRSQYEVESKRNEVKFDLAKERSESNS